MNLLLLATNTTFPSPPTSTSFYGDQDRHTIDSVGSGSNSPWRFIGYIFYCFAEKHPIKSGEHKYRILPLSYL
ncbi:MAG TPA: hypothetical protein DCR93_12690 [Cytophagales bacterium]|nr:hypothetical protein [Cytophagales bacterium]HAP60303.1 hypothetical protein [Cytophagales bacterium]